MKTINLPNGSTYVYDSNGQRVCTGSMMGRRNVIPDGGISMNPKLYLVKLKWVDGDYDQGGAYWGRGNVASFIYEAANDQIDDDALRIYVRASSRAEAKTKVRETIPTARFFN